MSFHCNPRRKPIKCREQLYPANYGVLSGNPVRNVRNLCISLVTLASRAAIRGGLNYETAFSMVDTCVQQIEGCDDTRKLAQLAHDTELEFARLVAEAKIQDDSVEHVSPLTALCCDYIYAHLHGRLQVSDIAKALHTNANYLSGLFHKETGITISRYIRKQKIQLARNMLMFSDYSYPDIAAYLGFSSQSHLGTVFREETGMTLGEYRRKNRMPGFMTSRSDP